MVRMGEGGCPVTEDVKTEGLRRKIELLILLTAEANDELKRRPDGTNAILYVACQAGCGSATKTAPSRYTDGQACRRGRALCHEQVFRQTPWAVSGRFHGGR